MYLTKLKIPNTLYNLISIVEFEIITMNMRKNVRNLFVLPFFLLCFMSAQAQDYVYEIQLAIYATPEYKKFKHTIYLPIDISSRCHFTQLLFRLIDIFVQLLFGPIATLNDCHCPIAILYNSNFIQSPSCPIAIFV